MHFQKMKNTTIIGYKNHSMLLQSTYKNGLSSFDEKIKKKCNKWTLGKTVFLIILISIDYTCTCFN